MHDSLSLSLTLHLKVGNALITIDSLSKKEWSLERVPNISPLNGNIGFKLNCHSESQVKH